MSQRKVTGQVGSPLSPLKKELAPEDFLSRADKLKNKTIPLTTENSIIVKANNEGLGFRFDCYPNNFLSNIIPKENFDFTVKGANKICENAWTEKKKHEDMDFNPHVLKIYRVALFFTILGLLLLLIHMYSDSGFALFPISFAFLSLACFLMLIIAFISLKSEPNFISLERTIRKRLIIFLEEENQKYYRNKSYEWRIERDFFWLELVNLNRKIVVEEGNEIKLLK